MTASSPPPRTARRAWLLPAAVAASSASGLAFEIALTRVFAIAQFYHFAFLSVSLALLGFGASGSALTAFPQIGQGGPRRWRLLAALQALATVTAFVLTNVIPFDSYAIAWNALQIVFLGAAYLVLAVPFFVGGLVVAVLLDQANEPAGPPSHQIYAASLIGSGFGAVAALVVLDTAGGEAAIAVSAVMAMGAALLFSGLTDEAWRRGVVGTGAAVGLLVLLLAVRPDVLTIQLSPYKDLSGALRFPDASVVATAWDQGTRIDLIESPGIRSVPGLGLMADDPVPLQDGFTFDGDDLSPLPRVTAGEAPPILAHVINALAFDLRPDADVLVLDPRGGLDLLIALSRGAQSVVAVEPHHDVVELAARQGTSPYDDPRIEVVSETARSYADRTERTFDIVDLALTSPYRPVASGAYSLAEDYRLTVEAFERYLELLEPDGIFTALRWVQTPPSEETRLLATAIEALDRRDIETRDAVAMLRGYSTAVVLVCPDGFSAADVRGIRRFAEAEHFDVVTLPGLDPESTNRFNVVPDERYSTLAADLLDAPDRSDVYRSTGFDVRPATDDRPFFGHFFTWAQSSAILNTLGTTWQPFGGAGFFVLIALLVLSTLAAIVLITVPLLIRRQTRAMAPARVRWWTLGYFGALGIGFLFIEIPLIQQFILLIGSPATAFAAVVFSILVASGVGSSVSPQVSWRAASIALTVGGAAYPWVVRALTPLILPAPGSVRLALSVVMIAPLGFLMGMMFPHGIARLESEAPRLVPWAWGINGVFSVIGSAAAAVLSLSFGFSWVLWGGALSYAGATILAHPDPAITTGLRG